MTRTAIWTEIALIGAPIGVGAGIAGCAMGPAALRTVDLAGALAALGHRVVDRGDIGAAPISSDGNDAPADSHARNFREIAAFARALHLQTRDALAKGQFPLAMGGDHSLSMGSVSGVARHCAEIGRELFVLWLDAHADFNTPRTSPSGNMHGMSLAMLVGEPGLDGVLAQHRRTLVKPGNVHLFGVRSLDKEERLLLAARGIHIDDMRQIDEYGVSHLISADHRGGRAQRRPAACQPGCRLSRSLGRARRRHRRARRRHLSRGASDHGDAVRFGSSVFARSGGIEPDTRRSRTKRAHVRGTRREPVRPQDRRAPGGRPARLRADYRTISTKSPATATKPRVKASVRT